MMANLSFSASVSEWVKAEKEREEAVFQTAVQDLANEVRTPISQGGRLPLDTGALRRSLMASTSAMPAIREGDNQEFTDPGIELVIQGAELGQTLWLGFQAKYALRMEYGFVGADSLGRVYNQAGFGFVTAAAMRWSEIVREAENKVRSRFESGPI